MTSTEGLSELSPKITESSKMSNKEIREEYFNQLCSWLTTVNGYQCFYNKLQQESLKNNYQQISKTSSEGSRELPDVRPEATTAGPSQFVGIVFFLNVKMFKNHE